jgi:ABC-type branched-subunit amino acid transport system substrate-binding protein
MEAISSRRVRTRLARRGRGRIGVGLVTVGVLALSACSSSSKSSTTGSATTNPNAGKPYVVSMVADLSGPLAGGIGLSGAAGLQGAVKAINDAGGVNGHPIKLNIHDSLSTAEGAQAAARAAIADNPSALYGSYASAQFAAILPVLQQAKVTMITLPVQSTLLSPTPPTWLYTVASVQSQIGEELYQGGVQALGGKIQGAKVAFMGVVSSNVDRYLRELKSRLAKVNATVVTEQRRDPTSNTFTSQAQNIVGAKPDVVIAADNAPGPVAEVKALRTAGYTGWIVFGQGAASDALFALKDPKVMAVELFKSSPSLITSAVTAAGATPAGSFVQQGWATGYALADSFKRCGYPCSSDALQKALDGLTNFSPPGDITFAPLTFSPTIHYWITGEQYFAYDSTKDSAQPTGSLIDVSKVDPPLPDH